VFDTFLAQYKKVLLGFTRNIIDILPLFVGVH